MEFQLGKFEDLNGIKVFEITYGGISKEELLRRVLNASIHLNNYAKELFSSNLFTTSAIAKRASIVELSVGDLNRLNNATMDEVLKKAIDFGLCECPLEIGPYLRLKYLEQIEQFESEKNKAPLGSVTVFSKPLTDDDDFPKGFYLRKIEGELWLRGYAGGITDILWKSEDRIALMIDGERK